MNLGTLNLYLEKDLTRIQQPFGIDQVFDLAHQVIAAAVLELHKLEFADADAVLPGAGTAQLHRAGHNLSIDIFQ